MHAVSRVASTSVNSESTNSSSVGNPFTSAGSEPFTSSSPVGTSVITDVNSMVAQASAVVCNGGLDSAVAIDNDDSWDAEEGRIARFVSGGCSCKLSDGGPCHKNFTPSEIRALRDECRELTHDELDLAVMGQLCAFCQRDSTTQKTKAKKQRPQTHIDPVSLWWTSCLPKHVLLPAHHEQ